MDLLIKNGRILDPANQIDRTADLLVHNGKIAEIGSVRSNSARVSMPKTAS